MPESLSGKNTLLYAKPCIKQFFYLKSPQEEASLVTQVEAELHEKYTKICTICTFIDN
jgi:hypothetical protein